jgi:hypothetical protein
MGGPLFGISGGMNLAYLDALRAMAHMTADKHLKLQYESQAQSLKESIRKNLWCEKTGRFKMCSSSPIGSLCQDMNGYSLSLGAVPDHPRHLENLSQSDSPLPLAFQGLGHWDNMKIVSPYATGFAVEALFVKNEGCAAAKLIERVWGKMAEKSSANYSGAHWEAMRYDGSPFNHDVSLVHGWSTWPVFLLPRYVAGARPLEPGWKSFEVAPVLADLDFVKYSVTTSYGKIEIEIKFDKVDRQGTITLLVPDGIKATIVAPKACILEGDSNIVGSREKTFVKFRQIQPAELVNTPVAITGL